MMRDALIVELINVDGQNLVTLPYTPTHTHTHIYIYIYIPQLNSTLINAAQKVLSYLKDN